MKQLFSLSFAKKVRQITMLALFSMFFGIQNSNAQRFTGKLIAGINGSQIDGDNFSGFNQGGLLAGFGAAFTIDEHWSVGPEFLYSMKGSRTTLEQMEELGLPRIIYKLNYFDVPVIATYAVKPGFRCMAGLSVNYLLVAKIDNGGNLGFVDRRDLFKNFDYQCLLGMEYEIFDNVWLQGRWSYSIVSTNAVGTNNFSFPSGIRGGYFNNLLQFSLRFDMLRGESQ
jgi:opacity protein-like surface antigen